MIEYLRYVAVIVKDGRNFVQKGEIFWWRSNFEEIFGKPS
jgi:hypothetical protein